MRQSDSNTKRPPPSLMERAPRYALLLTTALTLGASHAQAKPVAMPSEPSERSASPVLGDVSPEEEAVVAPATAPRPDWLTAEEAAFLESTGGLRPVANYDKDEGTVTIKLMKKGLTPAQIYSVAVGKNYDYYKRTDLVETSFKAKHKGKTYLFTGTMARKYVFGTAVGNVFVPVVTSLWDKRTATSIEIGWALADQATAMAILEANKDKLAATMAAAGVEGTPEEYIEKVAKAYGDTKTIIGRHSYESTTGFYLYEQKVVMTSDIANTATKLAGQGDIKGAALKVGYQVINEPRMAGAAMSLGEEVQDMSGETIQAGR